MGMEENSSSRRRHKGEEDRLSCLPDTILLEILSFLDMKHAVQTTILSKRWTDLWTSLGSLKFDSELFYSPTTKQFDGFQNFIDQVLLLRDKSDINTFHLTSLRKGFEIKTRLHTWILSVIKSKVRTLYIDVVLDDGKWLPNSLFTCNTLTMLTLRICDNKRWSITLPAANSSMCLPNLKNLRLCLVSFHDEYLTNKFFLSCPNLDGLVLIGVEFLHMNVNISALKLRYLLVKNLGHKVPGYTRWPGTKFKLHAPDLSYFICQDFMSTDYIMGNLPSLVEANIDMKLEDQNPGLYSKLPVEKKQMYAQRMMQCLRAILSVKKLKLSECFLEVVSGSFDLFKSEPTQLCDLTCLRLQTCLSGDTLRAIIYLLNISPNVESLFMKISETKFGSSSMEENPEADMSLQCVLYKLELVEIRGSVGCVNELKFLEIMLKNAKVLKKLVIYTSKEDSPDRERRMMKFTEKLLTFPKASSDITILFF